VTEPLQLED